MQLYNNLIIPFDDNRKIDFEVLDELIKLSFTNNDKIILFSPIGDGDQLSLQEKCKIIKHIDNNHINNVAIYFQIMDDEYNNSLIELLNKTRIKEIFLCPPIRGNFNQNGLFLITRSIIKKLSKKEIIIINEPSYTLSYHFHTIRKLISACPNLCGLYENSKDYSLLSLIKNKYPSFEIFLNEREIKKALELKKVGLISLSSLIFGKEIKELINDNDSGFTNTLLLDYLNFVSEILLFNNNSTLVKIYLHEKNYSSMNVRLPLTIDEEDKNNLDFLLS